MAKSNKITIRVTPARRTETISWQASGQFGELTLSQESGELVNQPLTSTTTVKAYWTAVLNAVLANLV